jgi:transposase
MDTSEQATVATPTRRTLRTNEEKRRIVAEALVPGASVAAVARKHGVNANLLFGWRRLHKRGLLEQCRESAALVPVKVSMPTLLPDRASRPARPAKPVARTVRGIDRSGHIEIALPGDVRVRVHGHVEPEALSAVLSALRGR